MHRILLACTAALAAGLMAVLFLNTVISQGAFRQNDLEIDLIMLAEKEERLARTLQIAESPRELERAARKLGMVPAASPVFLSLVDGRIFGEPVPAEKPEGRVSFKGAPGISRTPAPSAPAAASAQPDPAGQPGSTGETQPGPDTTTGDEGADGGEAAEPTAVAEADAEQEPTTEPGTAP